MWHRFQATLPHKHLQEIANNLQYKPNYHIYVTNFYSSRGWSVSSSTDKYISKIY